MNSDLHDLLSAILILVVLIDIGMHAYAIKHAHTAAPTDGTSSVAPQPEQPRIVVNMPADAKPMAQLVDPASEPGVRIVGSDRAVLWWTVFKACMDNDTELDWDDFINCADQAVDKAYGDD